MGPIAALDSVFTQFFTLRGRASRSEFWWYMLMQNLILMIAFFLDVYLYDPQAPLTLNPFAYFTGAWIIITLIPNFTVSIRRLHDSGKSGAYYLVLFIPMIGSILYLILMCLPSDRHQNYWGNPPFGPRGSHYQGHDPNDLGLAPKAAEPRNPYAGYALLDQANREPTPEMIAARKEEVRELYRTRVLGQAPTPQEG